MHDMLITLFGIFLLFLTLGLGIAFLIFCVAWALRKSGGL